VNTGRPAVVVTNFSPPRPPPGRAPAGGVPR